MSFFSKARAFTVGNMHELLDAAIDLNSPAVLKQYVRDLETAISKLRSEAVVQAGGIRILNREIGDLQSNITAKTGAIKSRLSQPGITSQDSLVRSWAAQVTGWQKELAEKRDIDLISQTKTSADLDSAVAKLETKHTEMVSNVRRLESAVHTSNAKNSAVSALEQAGKVSSATGADSIDNLQKKVRDKADIADERFDRAMGNEAFAESAETSADVDALLSSLK